ncbi:VOC family protein [Planktotalea sp.]|uniref:VOC family protein n=1 Tax=Planktotalea sp. TaxID=2029877 RepID=UPI0025DE6E08|nr:VOC family protein [Planktotalea sp.]
MKVTPYLTFGGNCAQALAFYAEVLGGEITMTMLFKEMSEEKMPDEMGSQIAHMTLDLGEGQLLFGSDTFEPESYNGVEGAALHVSRDSMDAAQVLFDKLRDGGSITIPLEKTSWSEGFGMCRDKFGVVWMIDIEGA